MPKKCCPSAVVDDTSCLVDVAREMPRKFVAAEPNMLQDAILNSVDFAIIATDADGLIQVFNRGAERLLGYDAS